MIIKQNRIVRKLLFFYLVTIFYACNNSQAPQPSLPKVCRLVKTTYQSSSEKMLTTFQYNLQNDISEMKILYQNGETEVTSFSYNTQGRLISRTRKNSAMTITYTMYYNQGGILEKCIAKRTDSYGNVINDWEIRIFSYNNMGKIYKINGTYGNPTYEYDLKGNPIQITYIENNFLLNNDFYTYNNQENPLLFLSKGYPDLPEYQNNNAIQSITQSDDNNKIYSKINYTNVFLKDRVIKQNLDDSNRGNVNITFEYENCE